MDALDEAEAAHAAFPESVPVRAALADARHSAGRWPEAVAALRPLVGLAPYRVRLAALLIRRGRVVEGLGLLRSATSLTDDDRLLAAQAMLDARAPEEAVRLLRPVAGRAAATPEAGVTLGLAQLQAGDYSGAAATLVPAAEADPGQAVLRYYAGAALRLMDLRERVQEAEGHLAAAVSLAPREAFFYYELGLCRAQLRDWPGARAALEAAAERGPDWPEVRRDLARVHERAGAGAAGRRARAAYLRLLGDPRGAVRELEAALRVAPQPALTRELAEAEEAAGNFTRAVDLLRGQRAAGPAERRAALWAEVRMHRSLQRYDDALAAVGLLEADTPDELEVLEGKAELLELRAAYPEAEALLRRLREREPENPYRSYRLGNALSVWYRTPEQDREAEAELRRALAMRPENHEANLALGTLLQRVGRAAEALPCLRAALDRVPTDRAALRLLALAYRQTGDTARAAAAGALLQRLRAEDDEEARLRVAVQQGRDPRARLVLARFYLRHGSLTQATRELELLAHRLPGEREARRLLVGLYGHARRFQRQFEERDSLAGAPRGAGS